MTVILPKNMSVFFVRDLGTASNPSADTKITQLTYSRLDQLDFISTNTRFRCQSTINFPATLGMDLSVPLCFVNRFGANGSPGLDLFVRTVSGGLGLAGTIAWISSNDGGNTWGNWTPLPGLLPSPGVFIASGASASAHNERRIIIVVRGSDNQLYRGTITPNSSNQLVFNGWVSNEPLGSPPGQTIVGEPAVIGFGTNSYRVYVRTASNQVWERVFNEFSNSLLAWTLRGGQEQIVSNASPEGVDRWVGTPLNQSFLQIGFNVFYRTTQNAMRCTSYPDSGSIITNTDFAGGLTSPSGSAYFAGRIQGGTGPADTFYRELHTFVRGNDGLLYGRYGKIQLNGTLSIPDGWYSFPNYRVWGKPDAVTWEGQPFTLC
ncbi:MAG: hypothetical protein SF123_23050 [Chloroflexota bacterium]|nr:hypothetical protein [Chloroflexota bacterium]